MKKFSRDASFKTESFDDMPLSHLKGTEKKRASKTSALFGRKTSKSAGKTHVRHESDDEDIRVYTPKHAPAEPDELFFDNELKYDFSDSQESAAGFDYEAYEIDYAFEEAYLQSRDSSSISYDEEEAPQTELDYDFTDFDVEAYEVSASNEPYQYADAYGEGMDYESYESYENYENYGDNSIQPQLEDGIGFDEYDSFNLTAQGDYYPQEEHTERGGAINDMQQEARRYIAELQAKLNKAEEEYDPFIEGLDADPTRFSYDNEAETETDADYEPEIDSRFNLSGIREQADMQYGGFAVDQSPDESYIPKQQTEYNPSQWTPDYDDPSNDANNDAEPPRKQRRLSKRQRKKLEQQERAKAAEAEARNKDEFAEAEVLDAGDEYTDPSNYDELEDYIPEEKSFDEEDFYFPPSFREYVLSLFASVFLWLRGTNRKETADTMSDTQEDLGEELSPIAATKYYGAFTKSMLMRLKLSLGLMAVLLYISLQLPLPGMLRTLKLSAIACFALQTGIMLLCLEAVTQALLNAFNRRFGVDTLAVIACIISGSDALMVAMGETVAKHMPICALTSLSLLGIFVSSYINVKALRKATRVPAIGKHFYAVTGELKLEKNAISLLKSQRGAKGFVRRSEEEPPDESMSRRISPILLLLSILFSAIVSIKYKCYSELIYILSVHIAAAAPISALSAFALPYLLGTKRVFRVGAAIAGWSGLCDLGKSKNLIVTDRDLFPEECISMENVRIFADGDALDVISYAGSLVAATGACSAASFMQLMQENSCEIKQIDGFECLPGGGAKGIIDGREVLCGSTDIMRLMNVRIPFRLTDKTSILLAIDGILYGIFSLHYEPHAQVRRALIELVRSNRHPVFAIRDFNINPEMINNTYDIPTDGYDFPPYVERFELTESSEKSGRIAAVVCNEGLAPLTELADVGRRMYIAIKANLIVTTVSAIVGVFFVFLRFIISGSIAISSLLLFMLLCAAPVILASMYVNTKQ